MSIFIIIVIYVFIGMIVGRVCDKTWAEDDECEFTIALATMFWIIYVPCAIVFYSIIGLYKLAEIYVFPYIDKVIDFLKEIK